MAARARGKPLRDRAFDVEHLGEQRRGQGPDQPGEQDRDHRDGDHAALAFRNAHRDGRGAALGEQRLGDGIVQPKGLAQQEYAADAGDASGGTSREDRPEVLF